MIAMPFHPSNTYTIDELNENLDDILSDVEKKAQVSLDGKVPFTLRDKVIDGKLYVCLLYTSVKETCPAPISSELTRRLQDYAVQGYRALGLESYARLDFIVTDDEKIYCLEANTLPGMTPTSLIPQELSLIHIFFFVWIMNLCS